MKQNVFTIYFTALEGGAGGLGGGYGSFGSGIQGKLDAEIPKDLVLYGPCKWLKRNFKC